MSEAARLGRADFPDQGYCRILLDGRPIKATLDAGSLTTSDGRRIDAHHAVYLAPANPSKILGVHVNYRSRLNEMGMQAQPAPTYFERPISALNAHCGQIRLPQDCQYLNYEGEIAIVIGTRARAIAPEIAPRHIAGYAIANDFTLHDFVEYDMVRAKGADSMAPVGPAIVENWDFRGRRIRTFVNGAIVQEDTTDGMIWDMHYLVADLSRLLTLEPGDIILSGTPANSRPVRVGDRVVVEVDGLGQLTNTVTADVVDTLTAIGVQPSDTAFVRSIALAETKFGESSRVS